MSKVPYEPDTIVLQKEEFSYGFILEVLTRGLYPNKHHVLREYVQNSYDAILAWRARIGDPKYGKITVKIAPPSVLIYDDGTGMDSAKINQYRYVGYSEKKPGEAVGFRGIGKLSGISVADKLIVSTSPAGVAERYRLVFEADEMLAHIMALKLKGQNIALNDLIRDHTSIEKEGEDPDQHYTMVELYGIKPDSKSLMDETQITEYLGANAPVDFDPSFPYGKPVDSWLRQYVADYDTVSILLNGKGVYKPYLSDLNAPQKGFVFATDEDGQNEAGTESPLAFYWYCEHSTKGQFPEKSRRGLAYRVRNFAVGSNQLPRITLWKASPERAYYFWGEIHICDPGIVPSSDREDFVQNDARERFYRDGTQISRTLNQIAGESSAERSAKEFIEKAEAVVQSVQAEADAGDIPQEIKFSKMYAIQEAIENVKKRKKDAPEEFIGRAEAVIDSGEGLIKEIDESGAGLDKVKLTYDIRDSLQLGEQAAVVYGIAIRILQEELGDQVQLFERLVRRIHEALTERFGTRGPE